MHRRHRLRSSADFDHVMRAGRRSSGPGFVLYHLAPGRSDVTRVGFSTGRGLGTAVVRNRMRRRLRVAVGTLLPAMVTCDVVVVARPDAVDARPGELTRSLEQTMSGAGLLRVPGG
jgi:ribonuclease P protein component